jgi:cytohesin
VALLKKHGGKETPVLPTGTTTRLHSYAKGHLRHFKKGLARGINPSSLDRKGQTPLHIAARGGHTEIVKLLLARNVDVNPKDRQGDTPIELALQGGHMPVVELLVAKGVPQNLFIATALNKPAIAKRLLKANPKCIHDKDSCGNTPLHFAASLGSPAMVSLLLKYRAQPDARNEFHRTPLLMAAEAGRSDAVALLLDKDVDTEAQVISGLPATMGNALHHAAREGHADVVKLLLKKKMDVNALTPVGATPLHMAVRMDMEKPKGDKQKATAVVLSWRPKMNVKNKVGNTPLHMAKDPAIVRMLIKRGADINAKGAQGNRPLHTAIPNTAVVQALLSKGAKVNAVNDLGETALHRAIGITGGLEVVKVLLAKGADVNIADTKFGRTPVHKAIPAFEGEKALPLLLTKKPDLTIKDKQDLTPLGIAIQYDRTELIELLKKHGAK